MEAPTGFLADHVLTGMIDLPWNRYPGRAVQRTFADRLLTSIRTLPGVRYAAINNSMPFTGRVAGAPVSIEGRPVGAGETVLAHHRSGVSGDYFAAMGIPLLRGRLLEEADGRSATTVCVIDQAMADRYWPGKDPIGRRLAFSPTFTEKDAATIVGVVANVKQNELGEADGFGMAYFPFAKFQSNFFYILIRTPLATSAIASSIRKTILQIDPELPIDDLRSLQTRIDDSLVARRAPALLAGLFAGVALLLTTIGLYGVMAYVVSQRTREFGIRLALGAQRGTVLRMVFRQGARLAVIGLAAGWGIALVVGHTLSSLLYGVTPHNPSALCTVAALLSVVAALACWLPARRATKVDPVVALRAE
jgi:predicted permease